MKSYFELINEQGGIDGRKIVLTTKDDGYQPGQDQDERRRGARVEQRTPRSTTMLGTPNNLAIWDTTQRRVHARSCSTPPARRSGATSRTTRGRSGMQLDYFTEAGLWAEWLQAEHPELKTVAEITFNNDFGQSYHNGFAYAIEGTDLEVVEQQTHEPTAPNLDNQFTTLAATNADVLLIETSGAFCTQAMADDREADRRGSRWSSCRRPAAR